MSRLVAILAIFALMVSALGHEIPKFRFPSKAFKEIQAAMQSQEALKRELHAEGKLRCCIKPPKGSQVASCAMCAVKTGACECGPSLAQGGGVCGECKGGWVNGKGAFDLELTGHAKATDIPVKATPNRVADHPHAKAMKDKLNPAKRVLVGEGRFNCCVGQGGCDECALEQYCGCGINLAEDVAKGEKGKKEGVCGQCLDGQHAGIGRIAGVDPQHVHVMSDKMTMTSVIADNMAQQGSGTTWLPGASPMFMKDIAPIGGFNASIMGLATLNYVDAGGKRGESQIFANTMGMLMLRKDYDNGHRIGINAMGSLDALTNGKEGYPNLFQTGETANGKPLKDRQHPHDLFMELSVNYSVPVAKDARAFLYLAPVGEPALGTAAFQHRPSAWENPEAPISHHWNDGTHITYGVATLGLTLQDKWKLEGSIFTGREPDEDRYNFDKIRMDSYSGRLTFNPTANWSLSASYGYLKSPEWLEKEDNAHRAVVSAIYSKPIADDGSLDFTAMWARNVKHHGPTDALTFEGAYSRKWGTLFARWENVEKDELVDVPHGTYLIDKFTIGGVKNLSESGGFQYGLGAYLDFYSFPSSLKPYYGNNPVSFGIFFRIRPSQMK